MSHPSSVQFLPGGDGGTTLPTMLQICSKTKEETRPWFNMEHVCPRMVSNNLRTGPAFARIKMPSIIIILQALRTHEFTLRNESEISTPANTVAKGVALFAVVWWLALWSCVVSSHMVESTSFSMILSSIPNSTTTEKIIVYQVRK